MTTVAVVDDDPEVRQSLELALSEAGYKVKVAANGLRLVRTLQVDRPDVIVLDVVMSWIDGYELCRSLKRNPEFRDIPVIFISGKSSSSDMDRGLACGAVNYFPKPLDVRALLRCVREVASAESS